jgi:hypothetical protein
MGHLWKAEKNGMQTVIQSSAYTVPLLLQVHKYKAGGKITSVLSLLL